MRERLARIARTRSAPTATRPWIRSGSRSRISTRWASGGRLDANAPIDASGVLVDGTKFTGPAELRQTLVSRQGQIVRTISEKMLTYALGRGLESTDAPVVRQIAKGTEAQGGRWSSLILEIVKSTPFRMRRSDS